MMTSSVSKLLFSITFLVTAQQTIAEEQEVEFYAFSTSEPDTGVPVKIRVIYPDKTTHEFSTGLDGRAKMTLQSCNSSVLVEARSVWGQYTKTTEACDPIPVQLAMIPTVQAAEVGTVLQQLRTNADNQLSEEAQEFFSVLKEAVQEEDILAAATAANDLQWTLHVSGMTRPAYEYGVFAQSVGFEAITSAGIAAKQFEDPNALDLMIFDHEKELIVMSPVGRNLLVETQQELGLKPSGAWDGRTFRKLDNVVKGLPSLD